MKKDIPILQQGYEYSNGSTIHPYSAKVRMPFKSNGEIAARYLGVELEIISQYSPYELVEVANQCLPGVFIAKRDGSIGEYGVEIVMSPHTLRAFPWEGFAEFVRRCRVMGASSWSNRHCGFHVHVDRNSLVARKTMYARQLARRQGNGLACFRIGSFMWRNQLELRKISGRTNDQMNYCVFRNPGRHLKQFAGGYVRATSERYSAVNFTNSPTIEFRLWRGSLIFDRLRGYLELTDAIVSYCLQTNLSQIRGIDSWSKFLEFLKTNPDYRVAFQLAEHCTSGKPKRRFIADPKATTRPPMRRLVFDVRANNR
jgi:hypothetical protein